MFVCLGVVAGARAETEAGNGIVHLEKNSAGATVPKRASVRLLILGDSLSSAYGLKEDEGWVSLIEKRLDEHGISAQIFNASIAGETTGGGLYRLPALLDAHKPDLIVIELGANDGLRGLSLRKFEANLDEIVRRAVGWPAEVIMAAIPVTSNYGSYVLEKMRSGYRKIGKKYDVVLVDFFDRDFVHDPESYQEDRLHPNAGTHRLIASIFWPEIEKIARAVQKKNESRAAPESGTNSDETPQSD